MTQCMCGWIFRKHFIEGSPNFICDFGSVRISLYSLPTSQLTISIPISIIFSLAMENGNGKEEKKLIENTFMHLRIFKSFASR